MKRNNRYNSRFPLTTLQLQNTINQAALTGEPLGEDRGVIAKYIPHYIGQSPARTLS